MAASIRTETETKTKTETQQQFPLPATPSAEEKEEDDKSISSVPFVEIPIESEFTKDQEQEQEQEQWREQDLYHHLVYGVQVRHEARALARALQCILQTHLIPKPYEARLVSFISLSDGVWDVSKVRLIGRDRKMNGTISLLEDMDDDQYSFYAEAYIDTTGSGIYKKLPYTMPMTPACKGFKMYLPYFADSAKVGVNIDFPVDGPPCPLPKGTYYLKDILLNTSKWPSVMPRGYMKGVSYFFKNGKSAGVLEVTTHVVDRD
ncbi:uncharacterized protein CheA84a [Drosophila pseudoobscura]|uniref:Uncharacterized protein CheA84a n=1 Tax=Drosophila pseudoobscura pseudoobscura TaxID=46245 RepID=A0A6I8VQ48_DROPS|nr:uncharacterized protein LOC6897267 [Drosophila pseudoobscura]